MFNVKNPQNMLAWLKTVALAVVILFVVLILVGSCAKIAELNSACEAMFPSGHVSGGYSRNAECERYDSTAKCDLKRSACFWQIIRGGR